MFPFKTGGVLLPSLDTTYGITVRPVQHGKNSVSVPFDPVTGELVDGFDTRYKRYELQSAARRLLPAERVCNCMRLKRKDIAGVSVMQRDTGSTYYAGLTVCGSAWVCPVCAAKISERRRGELCQAVTEWKAKGNFLAFVTLTVKHSAHSKPFELLDKLLTMNDALNAGRNRVAALVPGFVGQVRALEVTHGEHGWHPHLHVLLFLESEPDLNQIHADLWKRWEALHQKAGLGRGSKKAFTVQDGSEAAKYASKWGIPEEMVKGQFKTARSAKGRTPFALLGDYLNGDKQAGALFAEFAAMFKGRRQLRWSKGLRDLLGVGHEKTDEQEAQSVDALDEKLATITDKEWAVILRHNLRALVLEVFRSGATIQEFRDLLSHYQRFIR